MVLCIDEKSQIQALDRTQPGLPQKKGCAATITHNYKRQGKTTPFAALDVNSGAVINDCKLRHLAKEFLKFLRQINKAVPARRGVNLMLDNDLRLSSPEQREATALQLNQDVKSILARECHALNVLNEIRQIR